VITELKKSVHAKFGGLKDNNEGGVGINTDSTYRLKNQFKIIKS
jgi:hypothetical protein